MSTNGTETRTRLRDGIAEEVRALLARRRISATKLAADLGWTQQYLSRRLTCEQPFDADDMEVIASALNVPAGLLLPRSARGVTETDPLKPPVSPGPRWVLPRQRDDSVRPTSGRPPNRPSIVARPDRYLRTAPTG